VGKFLSALESVAGAQSKDDSRYVLQGVFIVIEPDAVQFVATDGRRLHKAEMKRDGMALTIAEQTAFDQAKLAVDTAQAEVTAAAGALENAKESNPPVYMLAGEKFVYTNGEKLFRQVAAPAVVQAQCVLANATEALDRARELQGKLQAKAEMLIPSDAVKHILRLPIDKKTPGEIQVAIWTNSNGAAHARFDYADYSVITKQIAGNFPNYKQVIPAESKIDITVNIAEFTAAVRIAQKATTEKSKAVKMVFANNLLTVSAKSPEIGEASAPCAVTYGGADFAIAFDPKYVLSAAEAFADIGTEMTLRFIDELSPVKITNEAGLMAVIMPMRLS
jgi:DNA polymerase III sliding clamp (beta) subunit (PCNA family)